MALGHLLLYVVCHQHPAPAGQAPSPRRLSDLHILSLSHPSVAPELPACSPFLSFSPVLPFPAWPDPTTRGFEATLQMQKPKKANRGMSPVRNGYTIVRPPQREPDQSPLTTYQLSLSSPRMVPTPPTSELPGMHVKIEIAGGHPKPTASNLELGPWNPVCSGTGSDS